MEPLTCGLLPAYQATEWGSIERAFSGAGVLTFRQAWRDVPEPRFRGGVVRVGQREGMLHLYAVLEDEDIFNPVTTFNEMAFLAGDAFEVFLRPEGQAPYYELHVTPPNQQTHLRLCPQPPRIGANGALEKVDTQLTFVTTLTVPSWVSIEPEQQRWRVLMQVPLRPLIESEAPDAGRDWRISCGRYDWTRGNPEPVLSSTSAHQAINFHRLEEWTPLRLEPPLR